MGRRSIRPGGQARHAVDLAQQPADELFSLFLRAELIDMMHELPNRHLDVRHRLLGVVLALLLQATPVLEDLLPVEFGPRRRGERGNGAPGRSRAR